MPTINEISISIIMPVYNTEEYLEETLNSVLSQTLKNIELICIDDGSKDSSLQILRSFKKKDERIQIITQENLGAGPARNAGLKIASGSYIAFLDSDDLYPSETCLQELYELAVSNKAHIAGGSLLFLDKGKISKAITKDADFTFPDTRVIKYKDFQQAYYYQRFIYSREMLKRENIAFPEYRRFQDVVFFVKAMATAGEFLSTNNPTYLYRKSNNYASLNDEQINDMLRGYIDVLTIAKKKSYQNLCTFLAGRIGGNNKIREMVIASIQSGNQTAGGLYPEVLDIINRPFDEELDEELDEEFNAKFDAKFDEKEPPKGLLGIIKSLFSGSGK